MPLMYRIAWMCGHGCHDQRNRNLDPRSHRIPSRRPRSR